MFPARKEGSKRTLISGSNPLKQALSSNMASEADTTFPEEMRPAEPISVRSFRMVACANAGFSVRSPWGPSTKGFAPAGSESREWQ